MNRIFFLLLGFLLLVSSAYASTEPVSASITEQYLQELQSRTKAYLDESTGLEWTKKSESGPAVTWYEAQEWIQSLGNGWRTPTLKELDQIEKNGFYKKFIRTREFVMWSTSRDSRNAWLYIFGRGKTGYYGKGGSRRKTRAIAVRKAK
jgi:hypothetical protein